MQVFEIVSSAAVRAFNPDGIVLQCGCDGLAKDRLGCFNLTTRAYGRCLSKIMSLAVSEGSKDAPIPLMVLGGGKLALFKEIDTKRYS